MLQKTGFILIAFAGIAALIFLDRVVDPPFFYRLMIWLFGGGFLLFFLWMLRLSQMKTGNLEQIVEERTRELTDANKSLVDEITRHHVTETTSRESENKYRLLAENANDIIWTLSMDLRFTYISPSILRIRGYTPEEGMNHALEEVLTPDSLKIASEIYAESMEKEARGERILEPTVLELEHFCKNGNTIWMEVSMSLLRDQNDDPTGIIGVSRDISDRKQKEKVEQQLLRSEKLASLGDMVAGVSHEVSTPLGAGLLSASYLQDISEELTDLCWTGKFQLPDVKQYAEKIAKASSMIVTNLERASELLNSFKNVAVDQLVKEKRNFNIRKNIEETLNSLKPQYKRTPHTITLQCPDDLMIHNYPGTFSQITTNLVMNSLVHGFKGIEKGEIRITIQKQGNILLFNFRDTGRGMDEAVLKKIYDPFFTTRRNRGGTGLGLHIVHNLVCQNLMGQITCISSPDNGTEFEIKIPFQYAA